MKSFNTQFKDIDSLRNFISEHTIENYTHILIQIFSGVIDKEYILNISGYLKELLPNANIIGATTSGEILDGKIYDESITISFSVFENTIVKSNLYQLHKNQNTEHLADEIITKNTKVVIIFSDGLKSNAEALLKNIYKLNPNMVIAGGRAGDNHNFKKTYVFDEKECYEEACVIATLSSDELIVNSDYILNWTPIGKAMVVTKADHNILYELDGIPILDIYRKYLGEDVVKHLPLSSIEFPLIIKKKHLYVARDPIIKTEENALVFAGNFEIGDNVCFSFGNLGDTSKDYQEYFTTFNFPSQSIFIYSCAARKTLMGNSLNEEFSMLESISPTVGFFTYGEYFYGKGIVELLNVTTTFIALSEKKITGRKELRQKPPHKNNLVKNALRNLIKVTNSELNHISTHDLLTSIPNRSEYIKRIELKIKSSQRYKENFGLIMADIDHFKLINDNYGHTIGDKVLKKFAHILTTSIREDDFVARWGGEEFVAIINHATMEDLEKVVRKIQKRIKESSFFPVPLLTASFGLTTYLKGDNEDSLFKRVDNALYTAKHSGRNMYVMG